jgi:hypothetical protein
MPEKFEQNHSQKLTLVMVSSFPIICSITQHSSVIPHIVTEATETHSLILKKISQFRPAISILAVTSFNPQIPY